MQSWWWPKRIETGGGGGGVKRCAAKEGARAAYELRDEPASYTNRLRATSMRHGCQLADWHRPAWPPCTIDQSFLRLLLRCFMTCHHLFHSLSPPFSNSFCCFIIDARYAFFWGDLFHNFSASTLVSALTTVLTRAWSSRCYGPRSFICMSQNASSLEMRGPIRLWTFDGWFRGSRA